MSDKTPTGRNRISQPNPQSILPPKTPEARAIIDAFKPVPPAGYKSCGCNGCSHPDTCFVKDVVPPAEGQPCPLCNDIKRIYGGSQP
jgi:hypothetical protein